MDIFKTKARDTFKIVEQVKNDKRVIKYILDLWPINVEKMKKLSQKSKFKKVKYLPPKKGPYKNKLFDTNARDIFVFKK